MLLPGFAIASPATPETYVCHPTLPNNVAPPAHLEHYAGEYTYFMDGIWAGLYPDGIMLIDKESEIASGKYAGWRSQKMVWTRDDGVEGPLIVTGQRLDAVAPEAVNLFFDQQYGPTGFTPVGITFPSAGCWQVVGIVGDHVITFTMEVVFVDVYPWMATPAA
jgi:hypothetical protein